MLNVPDLDNAALGLCRRQNFFGLNKARAKWLLNQQMATAKQHWQSDFAVLISRYYHADRVTGRCECFCRVKTLTSKLFADLRGTPIISLHDTNQFTSVQGGINTSMVLPQIASADHTTADFRLFRHSVSKDRPTQTDKARIIALFKYRS